MRTSIKSLLPKTWPLPGFQIRFFASDYFATLNVPRKFAISNDELKQSYHKLMSELHPDRQSQKSSLEQQHAASGAAHVTHAYNVLTQPHERAVHMLELLDRPLEEASGSELVGTEFLMEMMELREDIASAADQEILVEMMKVNQARMEVLCETLADAFDAADLERALKLTAELQYLNRVDQTLREKIDVA
jgi:Fe-S protein assembly co-chaperone HscB